MGDWADEKAREWLEGMDEDDFTVANVAALLREVANEQIDRQIEMTGKDVQETWTSGSEFARDALLAEVRRVIEEQRGKHAHLVAHIRAGRICDEILSSLEKL